MRGPRFEDSTLAGCRPEDDLYKPCACLGKTVGADLSEASAIPGPGRRKSGPSAKKKILPTYPCGGSTVRSPFGLGGNSAAIMALGPREMQGRDATLFLSDNNSLWQRCTRDDVNGNIPATPRAFARKSNALRTRAGALFFAAHEGRRSEASVNRL